MVEIVQGEATNTSGGGPLAAVPPEVDRWNWGAFLLGWIWGIAHNTWISLLLFVPVVNLAMPFVLGARGSRWAWRNRRWDSVAQFRAVQRRWAIAGVLVLGVTVAIAAGSIYLGLRGMQDSAPVKLALQQVEATSAAVDVLGAPVVPGLPMGRIEDNGQTGSATLTVPVRGSRASGTVYLQAFKAMGRWRLARAVLEVDDNGRRIELVPGGVVPEGADPVAEPEPDGQPVPLQT
ncbi:MAG: hypothetical protein JNM50_13135 [Chromatiales bacterium]|jgi:hypothetical protein|nr:hypothetical protein [Chromatiales bacterium]